MDNDRPQTLDKAVNSPAPADTGRGLAPPSSGPDFPVGQTQASQPNLGVAYTSLPLPPDEAEMDKAWVDQAVVVLDKTRDDPFMQSQEIAKLRAEYMQSKFDKKIKLVQERQ